MLNMDESAEKLYMQEKGPTIHGANRLEGFSTSISDDSYDVTPEIESNAACENVNAIITNFTFNSKIYRDEVLMGVLKQSLKAVYPRVRDFSLDRMKDLFSELNSTVYEYFKQEIRLMKKDDERRLCLEVALILLLREVRGKEINDIMYTSLQVFFEAYPNFADLADESEKRKLLDFSNAMKLALIMIPAKGNKGQLLHIATRISEGRVAYTDRHGYVTGSSQSQATYRRVFIYENESNVKAEKRKSVKRTNCQKIGYGVKSSQNVMLNGPTMSQSCSTAQAVDLSSIVTNNSTSDLTRHSSAVTSMSTAFCRYITSSCNQINEVPSCGLGSAMTTSMNPSRNRTLIGVPNRYVNYYCNTEEFDANQEQSCHHYLLPQQQLHKQLQSLNPSNLQNKQPRKLQLCQQPQFEGPESDKQHQYDHYYQFILQQSHHNERQNLQKQQLLQVLQQRQIYNQTLLQAPFNFPYQSQFESKDNHGYRSIALPKFTTSTTISEGCKITSPDVKLMHSLSESITELDLHPVLRGAQVNVPFHIMFPSGSTMHSPSHSSDSKYMHSEHFEGRQLTSSCAEIGNRQINNGRGCSDSQIMTFKTRHDRLGKELDDGPVESGSRTSRDLVMTESESPITVRSGAQSLYSTKSPIAQTEPWYSESSLVNYQSQGGHSESSTNLGFRHENDPRISSCVHVSLDERTPLRRTKYSRSPDPHTAADDNLSSATSLKYEQSERTKPIVRQSSSLEPTSRSADVPASPPMTETLQSLIALSSKQWPSQIQNFTTANSQLTLNNMACKRPNMSRLSETAKFQRRLSGRSIISKSDSLGKFGGSSNFGSSCSIGITSINDRDLEYDALCGLTSLSGSNLASMLELQYNKKA